MAVPDIPDWLVQGIIQTESAGNPWAIRYEPTYRWLWDVKANKPFTGDPSAFPSFAPCSSATELQAQKTSWGLGQIMGAVAREYGFKGAFLSQLCDPTINRYYMMLHLQRLAARFYNGDWRPVISAYNAGAPTPNNAAYVSRVLRNGGQA